MNVSEAIDIVVPQESDVEMKKRIAREKYRKYYVDNLEKTRKASLDRYYKRKIALGCKPRPLGRPRKYDLPEKA